MTTYSDDLITVEVFEKFVVLSYRQLGDIRQDSKVNAPGAVPILDNYIATLEDFIFDYGTSREITSIADFERIFYSKNNQKVIYEMILSILDIFVSYEKVNPDFVFEHIDPDDIF